MHTIDKANGFINPVQGCNHLSTDLTLSAKWYQFFKDPVAILSDSALWYPTRQWVSQKFVFVEKFLAAEHLHIMKSSGLLQHTC